MSKKTIVGKILEAALSLFKSNWLSFALKTYNKIPDDIKEKVSIGIMIVQSIKEFLASDKAKDLVDFIPGDWDNELRDWANEFLSEYNFDGIIDLLPRDSHNIATTATSELTGLSFGQSALTTEVVYQALKSDGKV